MSDYTVRPEVSTRINVNNHEADDILDVAVKRKKEENVIGDNEIFPIPDNTKDGE